MWNEAGVKFRLFAVMMDINNLCSAIWVIELHTGSFFIIKYIPENILLTMFKLCLEIVWM